MGAMAAQCVGERTRETGEKEHANISECVHVCLLVIKAQPVSVCSRSEVKLTFPSVTVKMPSAAGATLSKGDWGGLSMASAGLEGVLTVDDVGF